MFRLCIRLIDFLSKRDLTLEQRNELTRYILKSLDAFPLHCMIGEDKVTGEILINGNRVDIEKAKQLHEAAKSALNNKALKLVNEQVLYEAISMGVHTVNNPLELLFARAAMWYGEQQRKHLEILGQENSEI